MKYRVNAKYEASIQMDVIAESPEEAERKAREIFEVCDSEDFNIGNEIDIDADVILDEVEAKESIVDDQWLNTDITNEEQPILELMPAVHGVYADMRDIRVHVGNIGLDAPHYGQPIILE